MTPTTPDDTNTHQLAVPTLRGITDSGARGPVARARLKPVKKRR